MRELKFRAWDNVKFKMYYVGESEDVTFAFDGNGITATDLTEHDWGFKKLEHLQYMQYTGLHDKRGKELYEGDIVYSHWLGKYFVVEWDEIGTGYLFHFVDDPERTHGIDYYEFEDMCTSFHFEIAGNIYENPKLLEIR